LVGVVLRVYTEFGDVAEATAFVAAVKSAGVSRVQESIDPSAVLPDPGLEASEASALGEAPSDGAEGEAVFVELPPHPASASNPIVSTADRAVRRGARGDE
jgi:hypothetical protein